MTNSKRPLAALTVMLISIGGCATISSSPSTTACPPIRVYSAAQQDRMADELATLPAGAMLREAIKDYAVLREQIRACRPR